MLSGNRRASVIDAVEQASQSFLTRLSSERCVRVDTTPDIASTARLTAGTSGKEKTHG
jgi:hypothetical protein